MPFQSPIVVGQRELCNAFDEFLGAQTIGDQILHGDQLEAVAIGVAAQSFEALHRAVVGHDLANHARGIKARKPRQIHGCLGLPGAHEDAAIARAQRKRVTRTQKVGRARIGIEQSPDRRRAVVRRNAGRR